MDKLTPIQKAINQFQEDLKMVIDHLGPEIPSGIYARGLKHAYGGAIGILKSLLPEERKCIEEAFNTGYNNCLLRTGIADEYPYETTGGGYFDKTFQQ